MITQLIGAIQNPEQVMEEAGYEYRNIIRLILYTTSTAELWPHFPVLQEWLAKHGIRQASTFMEVKSLFETLTEELEATLVK
jgi:enamine deaminase RidA (YjgF/YER057c/UK114 family)